MSEELPDFLKENTGSTEKIVTYSGCGSRMWANYAAEISLTPDKEPNYVCSQCGEKLYE